MKKAIYFFQNRRCRPLTLYRRGTYLNLVFLSLFLFGAKLQIEAQNIILISEPTAGTSADFCAENPVALRAVPFPDMPVKWHTVGGTGTFSDSLSLITNYTPFQVTGSTDRMDEIIVTSDLGYAANYSNVTGIDTTLSGQIKCTEDGIGNSGGVSSNELAAGADGWVESIITSINVRAVFGLSATNPDNDYRSIDYGIHLDKTLLQAFVIEDGSFPVHATVSFAVGDTFRVERTNSTIIYKKNRQVFYTSTLSSTSKLFVDFSMFNKNDLLGKFDVNFGDDAYVFPSDTLSIRILPATSIDIGPDKTVCEDQTVALSLFVSGAPFGGWLVAPGTGSGVVDFSTSIYTPNTPVQTVSRVDTVIGFTLPAPDGVCPASRDTALITVYQLDSVYNTFSGMTLCEGDTVAMDAVLAKGGVAVQWTLLHGSGTILYADSTKAKYIPAKTSDPDLSRTDTLIVSTVPAISCTPFVDTVVLTVQKSARLSLSQDTTICLTDTAYIRGIPSGSISTIVRWDTVENSLSGMLPAQAGDTLLYRYHSNVPIVFPVLTRTDTLIATTANPASLCPAVMDTVIVQVVDPANISLPASTGALCEGDTLKVKATIHAGATAVNWQLLPGHTGNGIITMIDSVEIQYIPINVSAGDTLRRDTLMGISVGLSGCMPDTVMMEVVVSKGTTLTPVMDMVVCNGGSISLATTVVGPPSSTFDQWSIVSNATGGVFGTVNGTTTTYMPMAVPAGMSGSRIDTLQFSTKDPLGVCVIYTDSLLVEVYAPATVEVADPALTEDTLRICEGVGLSLDGSYGGGAVGATWSVVNNMGVFSNATRDTLITYTPVPGVSGTQRIDTVVITSVVPATTCSVTHDTLIVVVEKGPVVSATLDSVAICEGQSASLSGSFSSVAVGFNWSLKEPGSGLLNVVAPNNTASYTPQGSISGSGREDIIYLTSNNGTANCLLGIDSVKVFIAAAPSLDLGQDISFCGELKKELTPVSYGTDNQIYWTSGDGVFDNNPGTSVIYRPSFSVPSKVRTDGIIATSYDAFGLCPSVSDTLLVEVIELARIEENLITTICEEETVILNTDYSGTASDFTYSVNGNNGSVEVMNDQIVYIPNENLSQDNRTDRVIIIAGDPDGGGACPAIQDTIDITIVNRPRATLVGDTTVCEGMQVNLLQESFGITDKFESKYSNSLINYPSTPPVFSTPILRDTVVYGTSRIDAFCPAVEQKIIVTLRKAETIALNLPDTTTCETNVLQLNSGLSNPASIVHYWEVAGNNGVFDDASLVSPIYTPNQGLTTQNRQDQLILRVHANDNICRTGLDTQLINVVQHATLEPLNDTTICQGEPLNLNIVMNGTADLLWMAPTGNFSHSDNVNTTYIPNSLSGAGRVDSISVMLVFPENTCASVEETARVTIVREAEINAGADYTICAGFPLELAGTFGFGIDSVMWTVLNSNGSFSDANNTQTTYTPQALIGDEERIDILVFSSVGTVACLEKSDSLQVTIRPTPVISLTADTQVFDVRTASLLANSSEKIMSSTWRSATGQFTDDQLESATYDPFMVTDADIRLDTIIYDVVFENASCGVGSDTLLLKVESTALIEPVDMDLCRSLCLDTVLLTLDGNTQELMIMSSDINPTDACPAILDKEVKFWYPGLNTAEPSSVLDLSELPETLLYTCNDRGAQNVNVYIRDSMDMVQLCPSVINVMDAFIACGERLVSGRITTYLGEPMQGVQVLVEAIDGDGGVVPNPVYTDENGRYELMLSTDRDYQIRPYKNDELSDGVTAFDNVVISRHILGLQTFDSPFQTIAADVNKSGAVTAFDIVLIRKVVLARDTTFLNNTSWRFIDANYIFDDVEGAAAASFMESFLVERNMGFIDDMDFVGVKIGDPNGTASPNSGLSQSQQRYNSSITFTLPDQLIEQGKIYTIPFHLRNSEEVLSYQFTLGFSGLELLDIEEGIAVRENFGTHFSERGMLTTAWSASSKIRTAEPWFGLTFLARETGQLSELLTIHSDITPEEAYTQENEKRGISLLFSDRSYSNLELFNNRPNPFVEETTIGFILPEAAAIQLKIMDAHGKEIGEYFGSFEKGYNEMRIELKKMPKGILYYQLVSPFGSKTHKMMHLE